MPAVRQKLPIEVERIRQLVPHAGTMCLLERVVDYSAGSIHCETHSHTDPANPLRRNGHLSSICAIEYAAQAMALHGALGSTCITATQAQLTDRDLARHGYLVSVRQIHCHTRFLDTIAATLDVRAEYIFGDACSLIYSFAVAADETELVSGRASIMLG